MKDKPIDVNAFVFRGEVRKKARGLNKLSLWLALAFLLFLGCAATIGLNSGELKDMVRSEFCYSKGYDFSSKILHSENKFKCLEMEDDGSYIEHNYLDKKEWGMKWWYCVGGVVLAILIFFVLLTGLITSSIGEKLEKLADEEEKRGGKDV